MSPSSDIDPPNGSLAEMVGLRVLLVEDSWHAAMALEILLRGWGIDVAGPAGSLPRALALLEKSSPDLAIVDINLKGSMSYELIDRLLAAGIPVIVVSGYDDLAPLEGKVAATLGKPVRADTLLAALRSAIARRQSG
jgi:CheY-like chemotaxis protein